MEKQICPVCKVVIEGDVVLFSHGPAGTRERLKARVCQYAKGREGCINKNAGDIQDADRYGTPADITIEKWIDTAKELLNKYHKVEE